MEELDDFSRTMKLLVQGLLFSLNSVNLLWKLFNVLKRQMIIENHIFSLVSQKKRRNLTLKILVRRNRKVKQRRKRMNDHLLDRVQRMLK